MVRKALLLLCILVITACSTTHIRETGGGDWQYEYTSDCPSYTYYSDGTITTSEFVLNKEPIAKQLPDIMPIVEKAREYIKEQGGEEFLKRVEYKSVTFTLKDSVAAWNNRSTKYYTGVNCDVTRYSVMFTFRPFPATEFDIAVPLDGALNLVEEPHFPEAGNPDFHKIIPPQKAFRIAKRKYSRLLKKAESIALEYSGELHRFIWVVYGEAESRKFILDIYEGYYDEYWAVKIDAVTGSITGTELKNTRWKLIMVPRVN